MLQNINDSLNSLAFVGAQKFTPPRTPRQVSKYLRRNVGETQGAEQHSVVAADIPRAETLFGAAQISPKVVSRQAGKERIGSARLPTKRECKTGAIFGIIENMQSAIVQADESGREVKYPLRGTPIRYIDPFEPVADEDWEALR